VAGLTIVLILKSILDPAATVPRPIILTIVGNSSFEFP